MIFILVDWRKYSHGTFHFQHYLLCVVIYMIPVGTVNLSLYYLSFNPFLALEDNSFSGGSTDEMEGEEQ